MKPLCIPQKIAEKLKASVDKIDFKSLNSLSRKDRIELFSKLTNRDLGEFVNKKFERVALYEQEKTLEKVLKKVLEGKNRKANREDYAVIKKQLDKIKDNGTIITKKNKDQVLSGILYTSFGADVKENEARIIYKLTKKISEVLKKTDGGKEIGGLLDSKSFESSKEYVTYNKALQTYLDRITETPTMRVVTKTIMPANLLGIKSGVVNVISNTSRAGKSIVNLRIKQALRGGAVSGKYNHLVNEAMRKQKELYKLGGFDFSRAETITKSKVMPGSVLGEKISTGRATDRTGIGRRVNKAGDFYNKWVYGKMLTDPDVVFANRSFFDTLNLELSSIQNISEKEARELFNEALKPGTTNPTARVLRDKAVANACYDTYVNDEALAMALLKARDGLNSLNEDLALGTVMTPFVKVPVNVLSQSLESAGIPASFIDKKVAGEVFSYVMSRGKDNLSTETRRKVDNYIIEALSGVGAGYLLSSFIKPEDFIGAYDPKRKQIEELKNSKDNSIKVNGTWYSLDYFGPFAAPLVGFLYAKKYGNDKSYAEKVGIYTKGAGMQAAGLPVLSDIGDFQSYLNDMFSAGADLTKQANQTVDAITGFAASRFIPGILFDVGNATDKYKREYIKKDVSLKDPSTIYNRVVDQILSKTPFVREQYPEKTNVLGEAMTTEGAKTILFGARVKKANESPVIQELDRLANFGAYPSLTDMSKSSSKKIAYLRNTLSAEDFAKKKKEYGERVKKAFNEIMNMQEYKNMSNEEKKLELDNAEQSIISEISDEAGYEPEKRKAPRKYLYNKK